MKKFFFPSMLLLASVSYAQKAITPGTYLSTSEGQSIKLRLTTDKKFEIVLFHGDYEIKNDTLKLGGTVSESASDFAVNFTSDGNPSPGKVKVQLFGKNASLYSSSIYIGTQNGKATPVFKNLSEFSSETNYNEDELNFEVDRAEFIYLVKEDFYSESTIEKYVLPKNKNEIKFEYNPNYFGKMRLEGYYNEKDELVIAEKNKKSPLMFLEESKINSTPKTSEKPVETKKEKNWTYAGKTEGLDAYTAVDSTYAPSNFKLVVQDNFQKALESTKKTPQKFLVISYDPDNKMSKSEFDEFIKNQQYSLGSYMSYSDESKDFDRYNFYNASAKDKSWATKNKITDVPSTIVLDADGNILSQTKGSVSSNQYIFDVYGSASESLKQVRSLKELEKTLNGKTKEDVILKKLAELSDDNPGGWSIYPPSPSVTEVVEVPAPSYPVNQEGDEVVEEIVQVEGVKSENYYQQNEPVYAKTNIDKKKLLATWDKIVNSRSKDSKPNMDFVKVALAEAQNTGFYKKIFNEERLYDETNFKAIDYLIKHYDAILAEQSAKSADSVAVAYGDYYGSTIETLLPNAISSNRNFTDGDVSADYQRRVLGIYKKLMEKQSGNWYLNNSYFDTLENFARTANGEQEYVSEYDLFFNKLFASGNEIEVLNDLFSDEKNSQYGYGDWTSYKANYAQMSNQGAWFVVEKSNNPESIKKAIKWSESSLRIDKNSPYYLDTLAQLYYKNGEKQKAISTQEKAVKNANEIDETTRQEMEIVLEKMKNGTY
ncbi:tetratricopeptide repeat protein [Flavobacterium qiangtangense]|uniref:Tetratricopeptide repeat protein n=1 Tax=Flavobacterium qiangtangense TaxID=1442595 RepID=A0ABW1PS55_9FLAO